MDAEALRALQAPIKNRYREDAAAAQVTMSATGELVGADLTCRVAAGDAGLHPAAGGDGSSLCSADLLLQALVACAGVTLRAVATSMGIVLRGGTIRAEATLDFRGTLGVSRDVPIGLQDIRLTFDLDTDASPETLQKLLGLTERYCVVAQTLRHPPGLTVALEG